MSPPLVGRVMTRSFPIAIALSLICLLFAAPGSAQRSRRPTTTALAQQLETQKQTAARLRTDVEQLQQRVNDAESMMDRSRRRINDLEAGAVQLRSDVETGRLELQQTRQWLAIAIAGVAVLSLLLALARRRSGTQPALDRVLAQATQSEERLSAAEARLTHIAEISAAEPTGAAGATNTAESR